MSLCDFGSRTFFVSTVASPFRISTMILELIFRVPGGILYEIDQCSRRDSLRLYSLGAHQLLRNRYKRIFRSVRNLLCQSNTLRYSKKLQNS